MRWPSNWPRRFAACPTSCEVYIPQSIDYPGLQLNIDRERASLIGLSTKDVVDNVITAMTSDGMVAPSYWIDPKSGNNYMVTVQYANRWIEQHVACRTSKNIPLRGTRPAGYRPACRRARRAGPADALFEGDHTAGIHAARLRRRPSRQINTPTEVDHNQIRRVIDIYVAHEDRGAARRRSADQQAAGRYENRPQHGASQCAVRWSA